MKLRPLDSIAEHVGNTPLVRLQRCLPSLRNIEIWAKLEWFNPGGSLKDRAARSMIEDALAHGLPGCAGVALGVDRLMMAMLGTQAIADVVAFDFARA